MLARRLFSSTTLPPTIRQLLAATPVSPQSIVQVNGWVKSVRRQKKVAFAVISDGSSEPGLQAVFADVDLAKQYVKLYTTWSTRIDVLSTAG